MSRQWSEVSELEDCSFVFGETSSVHVMSTRKFFCGSGVVREGPGWSGGVS